MENGMEKILPDFCTKRTLILGCGNVLFGDDGFGPAVVEYLQSHYRIPDDVYLMDAGTGVRKLLFTLALSPERVRQIIIVDAVDKGRIPGETFEISLEDVPREKTDDLSLHQVPSSNLAKDLRDIGIDIHILVCQVAAIPEIVRPGLSDSIMDAVPKMSNLIARGYFTSL